MAAGWVSIHRSIIDHHFWGCEKFTKAQAWMDLIINANHKDCEVLIKNTFIKVKRGDQVRSILTLSEVWKWDRKTVKRFLLLLESKSMIVTKSTHQTTHITICNYSKFQDKEKNKGQQKGQQLGQQCPINFPTDNNVNNDNNVNKDQETSVDLQIEEVFMFWKKTFNHNRAWMDKSRTEAIKKSLRTGYSVEDLKAAITGCSKTPHNMGVNERNEIYDKLTLILRDAEQIDRFIRNAKEPPVQNGQSNNQADHARYERI